jgi:hypothetical protein
VVGWWHRFPSRNSRRGSTTARQAEVGDSFRGLLFVRFPLVALSLEGGGGLLATRLGSCVRRSATLPRHALFIQESAHALFIQAPGGWGLGREAGQRRCVCRTMRGVAWRPGRAGFGIFWSRVDRERRAEDKAQTASHTLTRAFSTAIESGFPRRATRKARRPSHLKGSSACSHGGAARRAFRACRGALRFTTRPDDYNYK